MFAMCGHLLSQTIMQIWIISTNYTLIYACGTTPLWSWSFRCLLVRLRFLLEETLSVQIEQIGNIQHSTFLYISTVLISPCSNCILIFCFMFTSSISACGPHSYRPEKFHEFVSIGSPSRWYTDSLVVIEISFSYYQYHL